MVELPDSVFGLSWNADLVQQVVVSQQANQRTKVAHVKSRGMVRGGGKKPWQQKGTGRARHGSIRSPIWKGGGVTHGPTPEQNYSKKINKKMARKALYTVLSAKARDKEILVLDNLEFTQVKTKLAAEMFGKFSKIENFSRIIKGNGALVALASKDEKIKKSLRNLPYANLEQARNLTAWQILQYKYILFTKDALTAFVKQEKTENR